MFGAVDIRGDLVELLEAIYRALPIGAPRPWWLWQRSNDVRAARENVHGHYDLGNDFYRLWLDREMVYTCAYFPTPDATPRRRADRQDGPASAASSGCARANASIEAGCGWGALALLMAKRYGVTVRAFNLSSEQIAYARDRAAREELAGRVEFVEDDYRNVTRTAATRSCRSACSSTSACPDYPDARRA